MGTLARKLKHMRTVRGLSMNKLAEMAGVSQPTISLIESGKSVNVTKETLEKLAKALHVDVNYFSDEGTRTVMELMGDKLPADLIEFVLAEDSMPYLVLAKEAWGSKDISEEALEWALGLLRKAQKGGAKE